MWLNVTHVCYVEDGQVPDAIPILSRTLVGSNAAIAANPSQLGWISNRPDLLKYATKKGNWEEPSVFFQLDTASTVPLNLPTGYAVGYQGQKTGLTGVLHRHLSVLQARAAGGKTLKRAPRP